MHLNIVPVKAPAATLPMESCFPLNASIVELTPLYIRASISHIIDVHAFRNEVLTCHTSRITDEGTSSRDRVKNTINPQSRVRDG